MGGRSSALWSPIINVAPPLNVLDEPTYLVGDYDSPEHVTLEELSGILMENLEQACADYGIQDIGCFEQHLRVEDRKVQVRGMELSIREIPYELIETLVLLAQRKTFKGKCRVCEDW